MRRLDILTIVTKKYHWCLFVCLIESQFDAFLNKTQIFFRLRFAADHIKKIGLFRQQNKIYFVTMHLNLTRASFNNFLGITWLANSQNLKSQTSNNHCQKLPKCWGFQVPHTQLQQQLGFFLHTASIYSVNLKLLH